MSFLFALHVISMLEVAIKVSPNKTQSDDGKLDLLVKMVKGLTEDVKLVRIQQEQYNVEMLKIQEENAKLRKENDNIKKEKQEVKRTKYINKWTSITARILHIEMDIEKHNKTSILVVYGPDENETAKVKDEFWNQLTEIIEAIKGRLIIIGDINGRVGKRNEESENRSSRGQIRKQVRKKIERNNTTVPRKNEPNELLRQKKRHE
ncbi:hypothetical protein RN001_005026 [Aquatica leii]|uniref:Craniofacial development protein 2-like n=1 Tax=Aquatica leii TaxID=1421715 RepID=A0AAN7Q0M6_9COLE|nr:hypothetical protein RN001_005026 [Aquatica leii]